jgi:hypothetical protein
VLLDNHQGAAAGRERTFACTVGNRSPTSRGTPWGGSKGAEREETPWGLDELIRAEVEKDGARAGRWAWPPRRVAGRRVHG